MISVVPLLPYTCGRWAASDQVNRMMLQIAHNRKTAAGRAQSEDKARETATRKHALNNILDDAMMTAGKAVVNKNLVFDDSDSEEETFVDAKGRKRKVNETKEEKARRKKLQERLEDAVQSEGGDSVESAVTGLSKMDMQKIKKARDGQWGNRWLLFGDPKTHQLYWYNRDTKVILFVLRLTFLVAFNKLR